MEKDKSNSGLRLGRSLRRTVFEPIQWSFENNAVNRANKRTSKLEQGTMRSDAITHIQKLEWHKVAKTLPLPVLLK